MSAERTDTLRLVTDAEVAPSRENIAAIAAAGDLTTQLLCTAVLTLMDEVKELKRQVRDINYREQ